MIYWVHQTGWGEPPGAAKETTTMYDSMIDYWADYGADVRHDPEPEEWMPLPQSQEESDALDAPEPEEPKYDQTWIDANAPF